MKIHALDRHVYAPELTTLLVKHGGRIHAFKAPGACGIRDARHKLFRPVEYIRYIRATVKSSVSYLDKTYNVAIINGRIQKNAAEDMSISEFMRWVRDGHKDFTAMNGEKVTYEIKFQTGGKFI